MRERDPLNVKQYAPQKFADREKAEAELQETFEQLKVEIKERRGKSSQNSNFFCALSDASPDLVFYRNDKEFSGCNRAMELLTGKSENKGCI